MKTGLTLRPKWDKMKSASKLDSRAFGAKGPLVRKVRAP